MCDWFHYRKAGHFSYTFSWPLFHSLYIKHRDKTTMSVLQGMLPRDLLHYCQEHGLLDSILIPEEQQQQPAPQGLSTGPAAAGTDAHPPPPRVEQQQQQQQQQP
jgi:hypothetical protein